jgi:voltage-gated potassium channel Kch
MANPRRRTARIGGRRSGVQPARTSRGPHRGAPTLRERLRYAFDNTMSRGTPALVGWLAAGTALLVVVFAAIVVIGGLAPADEGGGRPGVVSQVFKTILHALDPGTVAGDTGGWPFLLAMFGITIAGLFIVSALIGVIATGLDNKIEDLRKGRSFVIENDHTLVLGWSEAVYTILAELAIANESERDPVVVILSDRDRVEMEDLIRAKVGDMGKTRVVCRSGSVIDLGDLGVVNPQGARAIIVLSPVDDDPDAQVIKTVLALTKGPDRRPEPYHIVAEIQDPENLEAARLVGGDETVLIDKSETISRLIVQTSRQSGLSAAYTELLDFEGAEIYFRDDPALAGRSFGDALHAYEECTVIGLRDGAGKVRLNPPADTTIAPGEEIIAIAEDDEDLLNATADGHGDALDEAVILDPQPQESRPLRALVLGWNHRAPSVINELDDYVVPGSVVTVVADLPAAEKVLERECTDLKNLSIDFRLGDTTERRLLDSLGVENHDHVIVLCYSDTLTAQRADARTLVTLLHLRDIASRLGSEFTITSEMLDDRNRELAEVTKVDDVIVSDKLISLLLTQISENRHLTAVFEELFAATGSELYMRPAGQYVKLGQPVSFRTIVESARRRGEVAIGYRLREGRHEDEADGVPLDSIARGVGVIVNPPKSTRVVLGETDRLVVLAED